MDFYAIMKEDGAGDVLPKVFHPLCDPKGAATSPVALTKPFISGLLREEAGTDAFSIFAAGGLAFVRADSGGNRYVVAGLSVAELAEYDIWAQEHLTDPDLVSLFQWAWSLYPTGFYWVPSIHPRCILYKKGSPRQFPVVRKDGKLCLKLCVQRYAAPALIPDPLTAGLIATGAFDIPTFSLSAAVADVIRFPVAEGYSVYEGNGWTANSPSAWDADRTSVIHSTTSGTDSTALLVGDFSSSRAAYTDPDLGAVYSGLVTMTADDIAALRTEVFPADGSTELIASELITTDDITQHLIDAHGLSESDAQGLFPVLSPETGPYLPGLYTSMWTNPVTGTTGTTHMLSSGTVYAQDGAGSASDIDGVTVDGGTYVTGLRILTDADLTNVLPQSCFEPAREGFWTYLDPQGQTAVVTSPACPGDTLATLSGVNATVQRHIGGLVQGGPSTLTGTITLATGYTDYYISSCQIGIRLAGDDMAANCFEVSAPAAVTGWTYDATTGILLLTIDTEAAGLATSTDDNGVKTFDKLQKVSLSISISRTSYSGGRLLHALEDFGQFYGGGSYSEAGVLFDPPSVFTDWTDYAASSQ